MMEVMDVDEGKKWRAADSTAQHTAHASKQNNGTYRPWLRYPLESVKRVGFEFWERPPLRLGRVFWGKSWCGVGLC
jgi:hypothetical protein